jgi:hypothetical protein
MGRMLFYRKYGCISRRPSDEFNFSLQFHLCRFIVRQGMELTATGIAIGLLGALADTQALITFLFGISRLDPITYVDVNRAAPHRLRSRVLHARLRAARVDPPLHCERNEPCKKQSSHPFAGRLGNLLGKTTATGECRCRSRRSDQG